MCMLFIILLFILLLLVIWNSNIFQFWFPSTNYSAVMTMYVLKKFYMQRVVLYLARSNQIVKNKSGIKPNIYQPFHFLMNNDSNNTMIHTSPWRCHPNIGALSWGLYICRARSLLYLPAKPDLLYAIYDASQKSPTLLVAQNREKKKRKEGIPIHKDNYSYLIVNNNSCRYVLRNFPRTWIWLSSHTCPPLIF